MLSPPSGFCSGLDSLCSGGLLSPPSGFCSGSPVSGGGVTSPLGASVGACVGSGVAVGAGVAVGLGVRVARGLLVLAAPVPMVRRCSCGSTLPSIF